MWPQGSSYVVSGVRNVGNVIVEGRRQRGDGGAPISPPSLRHNLRLTFTVTYVEYFRQGM